MNHHYEVIVVGAGSMGMAAGYYLSRKGVRTLMIDAFDPPHSNGRHSGDTRLIRHACGEGPAYAPLALRAQTLWDDLAAKTSETIFRKTGVLTFGPASSQFVKQAIESGHTWDMNIETLSAGAVNERWPGAVLDDADIACYEPDAGVLFSDNCIRTFRRLALDNGAELKTEAPVTNIDVAADSVTVETDGEVFTADKLIVSGGAWNKKILSDLELNIAVQASRRTIAWFKSNELLYNADTFPGFFGDLPSGVFYGFPSIDGGGVKAGRYDNGDDAEPEYINREFGIYDKDEGDVRGFLDAYMPEASGRMNVGSTCLFTNTPDENFVIDLHPEHSHIAIAAGFSGHGYKFSTAVGEILSELVTEGTTEQDISLFSAKRPALYPEGVRT